MKGPTAAVKDHWTTFWALVAAATGAIRQQWRLALFPLVTVLAVASLYLGLANLWVTLFTRAPDVMERFLLPALRWWPLAALVVWYLVHVTLTFWSVALTHAALSALRQQPVSLYRAQRIAIGRLPAILGFAVVSSTLGAALSSLERRSQWVVRAFMAVCGLSWTLISLFALTAMSGEKLGAIDSFRRGGVLLRATWAEKRLTTLGLGLLWVPLLGLEFAALWLIERNSPSVGHAALYVTVSLNTLLWAVLWLLERVYVAAVYCYAVEGVVPSSFASESLQDFWQAVGTTVIATEPAAAQGSALRNWLSRQELSRARWRTLLALAMVGMAAFAYLALDTDVRRVAAYVFPGSGMKVDAANFPTGPRRYRSLKLRGGGDTRGIVAATVDTAPAIFVFQRDGFVRLDRNLRVVQRAVVPARARSLEELESFEPTPGTHVLVGWGHDLDYRDYAAAIDPRGKLLFERVALFEESEEMYRYLHAARGGHPALEIDRIADAAINAVAPVRTPTGWGLAVGYNGSYGLCLLDEHGQEQWCNRDVGNVWYVTTMDCDGDGTEEILSVAAEDRGSQMGYGCYTTAGQHLRDVALPRPTMALRAIDLDGDGKKELAYHGLALNLTGYVGVARPDGTVIAEAHVSGGLSGQPPLPVRRSRLGPRDIVTLGPQGELLGLSLTGARWSAGSGYAAVAVIDLDGDGLDEIVGLAKPIFDPRRREADRTITAWTWGSPPLAAKASSP